ncbi:MAG: 2OG-Fe(II) oxygenase [Reichenbachiella sp.]|uniref:2OG-Fe(II) oxygenase n=1 Tax=Reichenbachiella sp. TaxID=2184521 RepID=UPI00326481C8
MNIQKTIETIDWKSVASSLNEKGFALVPQILSANQCKLLIENYDRVDGYRKTVLMERHRFGLGEYKYYDYPLPGLVRELRESIYPYLVPIANLWMKVLKIDRQFPDNHGELINQCHTKDQIHPTALILKYGKGGFNTLHQDLYGEVYFPLQAALFLNDSTKEYDGGEFVLAEQIPRAQSKVVVLRPNRGDLMIFTTNFRPIKGSKGYYRANVRHGVSEVLAGERHTLGIIFHDAIK